MGFSAALVFLALVIKWSDGSALKGFSLDMSCPSTMGAAATPSIFAGVHESVASGRTICNSVCAEGKKGLCFYNFDMFRNNLFYKCVCDTTCSDTIALRGTSGIKCEDDVKKVCGCEANTVSRVCSFPVLPLIGLAEQYGPVRLQTNFCSCCQPENKNNEILPSESTL